jgi:tetratricopeptide (TPR) repeat protein
VAEGRFVSHYEVLEPLGRGGMGVVHKARDVKLGRLVALKFVSPELIGRDDVRERFFREARSLSSLSHPHIATVYEVDEADGSPFLAMEYLPGGTLRDQIRHARARGGVIEAAQLLDWGTDLAEGLAHAHANGIVHRDVKSSNAMFDGEGRVKLTDFGLAKVVGLDATSTDRVAGTVEYMSPEQLRGGPVDHRSDLYSLGVVLYELAAMRLPYSGSSPHELVNDIVGGDIPSVTAVRPDCPAAFDQVVTRLLSKSAADRYQSAQDVADDLARVRSGALTNLPTTRTLPALRRARRLRTAVIGAGVVAVLGVGYLLRPKVAHLPEHKHVVVLPLRSIGGDTNQTALCDGLTETLTTALTQTGLMSVVPASDVRKIETVQEAHREFGVNLVLYGSLQRRGDRLRLTVNLADAEGERQLGAEVVEGQADQPLQIEEAMIEKVAALIDIAVPTVASSRTAMQPTPGAYEAYLRGRGFLYRYDLPGNLARALEEFQEAIRNDPRFALGHAGLAEARLLVYRQRREPAGLEAAKAEAQTALALNPALASARATYGAALAEAGEADAAITALEQAIDADPRNPTAYRELAIVYRNEKKFDRAEEVFKKAIRARPGECRSYLNLATFYAGRQRYADAETNYRKAIELSPDNHLPYRNLGAMLIALGRHQEAESLLLKARALNPTARAASNLGTLYIFEGRYREAVPILEEAVARGREEFPNDYRIWGNLGDAYWLAESGEDKRAAAYRKAIEIAERLRASDPHPAEIDAALAEYFAKLGDAGRARERLAAALGEAPENALVRYEAGVTHAVLGEDDLALQELKEALTRGYAADQVKRAPELKKLRDAGKLQVVLAYSRPRS